MKKAIFQAIVSMAMAIVGAAVCIHFEVGYWAAPIAAFFICALFGALVTGFFDEPEHKATRYESIKHRMGGSYGQAAVFIGTAAIFMGTPKQCEDVCDDLWHYGQQAHVELLTGSEVFEVL